MSRQKATLGSRWYLPEIERLLHFLVPPGARVLVLGCRDGRALAGIRPVEGVGMDESEYDIESARQRHAGVPGLQFQVAQLESVDWSQHKPFDYVVCDGTLPLMKDAQAFLERLHAVCAPDTRLIATYQSNLWRPLITLATGLGIRRQVLDRSWFSTEDMKNIFHLAGYEVIVGGGSILLPVPVPGLAWFMNRVLAHLPFFRQFCLIGYLVVRPVPPGRAGRGAEGSPSVSIMVPTRNEKGNVEDLFARTPRMGSWTELVFVDGHSSDGTWEEIEKCSRKYASRWPRVKAVMQDGKGKGQAVRQGFERCEGDVLMVLDSDLTMPPEELPKYYEAIVSGKGEFINGCRLVYPQEDRAMRFLNMVANHFFAKAFTWLLSQPIKDTLCGTKVLWRRDYAKIAANRSYFGDFDPFGDFDLLFGAAKLHLKIVDLPIRYRSRTYGEIKINRWRDGMLLLRMCLIAYRRFKTS